MLELMLVHLPLPLQIKREALINAAWLKLRGTRLETGSVTRHPKIYNYMSDVEERPSVLDGIHSIYDSRKRQRLPEWELWTNSIFGYPPVMGFVG